MTIQGHIKGNKRLRRRVDSLKQRVGRLESAGCLGMLVAVFHPAMYIVGTRAGIRGTLFSKGEAWVQA